MRLQAPLLYDIEEHGLVGIGQLGNLGSGLPAEAWVFREGEGWHEVELPPAPLDLSAYLADPAHRRFLARESWWLEPGPTMMRYWALELSPAPHWVRLDEEGVPSGIVVADTRDDRLWSLRTVGQPQLWSRSLSDTGAWRLQRSLPPLPGYWLRTLIDLQSNRLLMLGRRTGSYDSVVVWTTSLADTDGWYEWPRSDPTPHWPSDPLLLLDSVRDRVLLLSQSAESGDDGAAWSLDLADGSGWSAIEGMPSTNVGQYVAVWGDSLWGWGRDTDDEAVRVKLLPLADPTRLRVAYEAVWPGEKWFEVALRDPATNRWYFTGGWNLHAQTDLSPDTLYELTLDGDAGSWRKVVTTAEKPFDFRWGYGSTTADPERGVLYFHCRLLSYAPDGRPEEEVWAMPLAEPFNWSRLWSGPSPTPHDWPAFKFDPIGRRLLLFGLWQQGDSTRRLVYTLDVDAPVGWVEHAAAGSEVPRSPGGPSVVADPVRGRLIFSGTYVQGGDRFGGLELHGDPAWIRPAPGCVYSGPSSCPKGASSGVFDPIGRRAIQVGGESGFFMESYDDLWSIESGDTIGPVRRMDALGSPGPQVAPPAGYDPTRDALLVFGFADAGLYEFRFDRGQAPVARLRAAVALPDRNRVEWTATPSLTYHVWRRERASEWSLVNAVESSAGGELRYDDRGIQAGVEYGYRLTGVTSTDPLSAGVWLTASGSASFSLSRPWPNPTSGAFTTAFTLVASAPADLDVFDLAGRRVWSRRWEAPSPGPHHLALTAGELPRSGLFFLRLRQGGRSETTRIVVTR